MTSDPRKPNRLAKEKSPYLLQHACNPVDWHPWGPEAFEKARRENKPIFLSIGYSTCHWCHVMEHESFENAEIAEVLNRWFVPIKVDREERPDVDQIYMTAVQAMTGQGGWPLSAWLTPDLKPFYGGTYFPPRSAFGRPGFKDILTRIHEAWEQQHEQVLQQSRQLHDVIASTQAAGGATGELGDGLLRAGYDQFHSQYDDDHGGFGGAPKFPRPAQFNFLLRHWKRTGNAKALEMTAHTLRQMALGGMYDQLGGGFARYSVDERWHVPHFEKMLYDNAQLVVSYCEAWQITREPFFADVARDVLRYVMRDMTHAGGAFYSAEDADSEGVEGKFYAWTTQELRELLGADEAKFVGEYFGCEEAGNWDDPTGHGPKNANVLFVARTFEQMAKLFGGTPQQARERIEAAKRKLFEVRSRRVRPHLDDKILTAWNGQMIGAFARAAQALDEPQYLVAATRAAEFVLAKLYDPQTKTLLRRWRDGEAKVEGFLDDYAFFVAGLLELYETSFDPQWLDRAAELTDTMLARFHDDAGGGFWFTPPGQSDIITRMKDDYDGAQPSGNAIAIANLQKLAQFTANPRYAAIAGESLQRLLPRFRQGPTAVPQWLCALDAALAKHCQIVIAGSRDATDTRAMLRAVRERYLPNTILLLADGGPRQTTMAKRLKFLADIKPLNGKATAYVCENYACRAPTNDLAMLQKMLDEPRAK
ncbi:MAG: thioredoxin domain-containing protein [Verrucomicrobia bacterium]|nr:thioredoxin domain-containing protein [Verrucomicrobiota bacterium]